MTYLAFHIIFTIPLFLTLVFINKKHPLFLSKRSLTGAGILVLLATTYTTPWDSYLIKEGIWTYDPNNILFTFYRIPIEEYFFFIIQTLIGCLLTLLLLPTHERKQQKKTSPLSLAILSLIALLFLSSFKYIQGPNPYRYLNLITVWSMPVLFLQWSFGHKILLSFKKELLLAIGGLTSYFWVADSIAISQQVWTFPSESISQILLFGVLPIEEALFFFVTNCMVVQGFILFVKYPFSTKVQT